MPSRVASKFDGSSDMHIGEDLCIDLLHNLLPAEEREQVLSHMSQCSNCESFVRKQFGDHLQSEVLGHRLLSQIDSPSPRRVRDRLPRLFGLRNWGIPTFAALVSCLVLAMLLPPRPEGGERIDRNLAEDVRILRPIAGEIVHGAPRTVSWTPIEGARLYRLTLQQVGGGFKWSDESTETRLRLPAGLSLPSKARFHAFLEPIPSYRTAPGGISTTFRTGSLMEWILYRLRSMSYWAALPGLIAQLSMIVWFGSWLIPRIRR